MAISKTFSYRFGLNIQLNGFWVCAFPKNMRETRQVNVPIQLNSHHHYQSVQIFRCQVLALKTFWIVISFRYTYSWGNSDYHEPHPFTFPKAVLDIFGSIACELYPVRTNRYRHRFNSQWSWKLSIIIPDSFPIQKRLSS